MIRFTHAALRLQADSPSRSVHRIVNYSDRLDTASLMDKLFSRLYQYVACCDFSTVAQLKTMYSTVERMSY